MSACGQENGLENRVDALCRECFPDGEPGAAVLIMVGDDVVFDRGYGIADLSDGRPIDGDTFFNIASVSKQFTAVAVLQLAERGLLSLDDEVRKYFPEFADPIWEGIFIKHLLSHSSGIPDARSGLTLEQRIGGDEALATAYLYGLDRVNFEPGTNYEYINPTFVLLGLLVERVSGMEFTEFVTQNIFRPAGMERTLYFDRDRQELIPDMAHGYEYEDVSGMPEERVAGGSGAGDGGSGAGVAKPWYEYAFGEETFFAARPDGGIYASTPEFVKWEKALRACCAGEPGAVLSRKSIEDAHSPHTCVSGSPFSDYQNRPDTWYGYGWFLEPSPWDASAVSGDVGSGSGGAGWTVYRAGANGGFKILAARYPAAETLVLIFANRADWDRYALMKNIEAILAQTVD